MFITCALKSYLFDEYNVLHFIMNQIKFDIREYRCVLQNGIMGLKVKQRKHLIAKNKKEKKIQKNGNK